MDENVKYEQLSDEELDNVTGGEARPLGDGYYYVNEIKSASNIYKCPKCGKTFYIPIDLREKFKYNYGVSGGDDIYCPDCYPKAMLEYICSY